MWNTDDVVPQKDIKSPYGGGVSTLPGAAGGTPPAMFPVASALPIDEPQLDSWQVAVVWVDETPAGDSSEQESPCDSQNRRRPMDTDNSPNSIVHSVVQGGPVGPRGIAPLALLVLNHADPADQRAAIQSTTSLWERLHAQPEPPCGDGLVERIPDEEPTVRQVSGSALDSQLMEGITYSEVSLDSRPMEGSSGLKSVQQSILRSPRIMRPQDGSGLVERIPDEEPTVCQVPGSALDSQLMEGISQPELRALGAPSDCRPMEGVSCLEPVKQSILRSSQTKQPQISNKLIKGISDKEPTVCQVPGSALDSQLMEGITYTEVSLDSRPMEGSY